VGQVRQVGRVELVGVAEGVLHYLQYFDIFVADLIIDFVEASCILPISIIYPFYSEDIIAVFLIKCVNGCLF
jgi:hypothetical protein